MNWTERIRNEATAFYAAIGVIMLVQGPHLAYVWYEASHFEMNFIRVAVSVSSAIFFDLGVLFFAVRGRTLPTMLFMISSAVITIRYYLTEIVEGNWINAVSLILMAIVPALLIYFISEELNTTEKDVVNKEVKENLKEAKIAKIIQLRKEGATWSEIQDATGASKQFISNALKSA